MQTIEFLRNFFTKRLEIHYSFLLYFPDFFKNLKFQNSNMNIFKISIFQNFKCEKSPKFEFKNCQISNRHQKVDPTASKSTSQGAFRIVLRKISFCQSC
jgi:hypothetical protein